ncbi:transposase domain-containing protein, partial [Atlanticothrix silvestris]|uniref:transposase domain-containing protein n=1 Tax=Atlanticothrix silvestris TaxID=2840444 RepID=UPI0038503626
MEQAIANTKTEEERTRSLPAQLMVSLVIAMSLWSRDSMRDVLKNLVDGLSVAWVKVGKYWRVPCKSAITQARQRLGAKVMSQLFHQLVKPMATGDTLGWIVIEVAGVGIYGLLALLGLRYSNWWLMLGWMAHPLWDIGLHLVNQGSVFTP